VIFHRLVLARFGFTTALLSCVALGSAACSADPTSGGETGGSLGNGGATGGGTQTTGGGTQTTGGSTQTTGGTNSQGGSSPNGGSPTTGGSPSTTGGNPSTTGGAATSGGSTASGGAPVSGGTSSTGGTTNGGTSSTGGTTNGGTSSTGGNTNGGANSTGGITSGGTSTGGTTNGGATSTIPNQAGNPLVKIVSGYTGWLSTASTDAAKLTADQTLADNAITWQMPHGGWFKYGKAKYAAAWNGSEPRADWTGANSVELGTIDNSGTVTEIMFLADVYRRSNNTKYRDAARKGLDFIFTMQTANGGFPQVYPQRPNSYSNNVTFNDDAMVRVLGMLDLAAQQKAPFTADTFSAAQLTKIPAAISKAVDYILKAQIVQGGVKTVWCAQHDPSSYAAVGARSYELPSKSGSESIGVVGFLLSQPQTAAVKAAAQAAIAWYKSDAVKVANTAYVSRPSGNTDDSYNPIQSKAGSTLWYRFYDLDKDTGFFSGRLPTDDPPGTGKKYNIMDIEAERRYGYQWGGSYGTTLFAYTDKIGY
jgi:PelA/Pel-15E family pectate lyase